MVVKEDGRCLVFCLVVVGGCLCASSLSSLFVYCLPSLPISVFWLFHVQAGSKEPLDAHYMWLWLRETGKSHSSGHLDRIAPVVACSNGPTVQTTASSLSNFTQDWRRGHH